MKKPKRRWTGIHKVEATLLLLVGLKLGGQLDWAWWWVLSPQWIWAAFRVAYSACGLFGSSQRLLRRQYKPGRAKWSLALRHGDALFILFFVLKWTGYLSWSWFWVLFPLWFFKPLGLLVSRPLMKPIKRRRYKALILDLESYTVIFTLTALVALRLDGHISSWWWVAAACVFYMVVAHAFAKRSTVALSRRLHREKAKRRARRERDDTEERRPIRSAWEVRDSGRS